MKNKSLAVSVILAVVIIAGALLFKSNQEVEKSLPAISSTELKEQNGMNNKKCWVAVDGTVYEIEQGFKWVGGKHTESEGQAFCGADLSKVIDKSKHGRAKLYELEKVGTLN